MKAFISVTIKVLSKHRAIRKQLYLPQFAGFFPPFLVHQNITLRITLGLVLCLPSLNGLLRPCCHIVLE